jgi:hypothetical protein
MRNTRLLQFPVIVSVLLSLAPAVKAAAIDDLPLVELAVPAVQLAQAETYPDYVQDRKPAALLRSAGDTRVIGGVRFERDAATGLYAWREASVDESQLAEAYWGYRSGGVGHSFLMFTFNGGAVSAGKPLSGLVVEALPWEKKGEDYSPFGAGLNGHYPLIWNVVAWDSFLETSALNKYRVDVYPLKLSREEKIRLLDEAIKHATGDYSGEKYNTFFDSCSTNALKVFTAATGHQLLVAKMLPAVVVEHLKLRGFLGDKQSY